jgi:hypothetical protein
MSAIEIEELKALALAASPGPWGTAFDRYIIPASHLGRRIGGSTNPHDDFENFAHVIAEARCKYLPIRANATYIAAANPAVVLVLLADLAAARALLADIADNETRHQDAFDAGEDDCPPAGFAERIRALLKDGA